MNPASPADVLLPFAQSRNDDPDNGLALSRDAHWMFDEHLWCVNERLRVVEWNF